MALLRKIVVNGPNPTSLRFALRSGATLELIHPATCRQYKTDFARLFRD